jgi:hypothetical protein
MSQSYTLAIPRTTTRLAKRLAQPFTKRNLIHAARAMGPTLLALAFAGAANVAHAQGTMDFSGAQTLMGTFKTLRSTNLCPATSNQGSAAVDNSERASR